MNALEQLRSPKLLESQFLKMSAFRKLVLLLSMTLLTACGSTINQISEVTQETLLQECPKLSELSGSSGEDIYPWAISAINAYNECATVHSGLVESIRDEIESD